MSLAVRRSILVIRHLKTRPVAQFKDLARELAPISSTALSKLLQALVAAGELVHNGRIYALSPTAASTAGGAQGIYSLPLDIKASAQNLLEQAANDTMHSCAMFGWVGNSTMKILAEHNLPGWLFSPVGYEWPLVPFHGFAQVFLAYGPEVLARDCFYRWYPYLQTHEQFANYPAFLSRLRNIRKAGYAVEYRGELPDILRLAVPVHISGSELPRYAVGISANAVCLLELEKCLKTLYQVASDLARLLKGRVPLFQIDIGDQLPKRNEDRPLNGAESLLRAKARAGARRTPSADKST
jgi:DNA-binding IclR family transcriptional regulator